MVGYEILNCLLVVTDELPEYMHFIRLLILVFLTSPVVGQNLCTKDKIVSGWMPIGSIFVGRPFKMDSLLSAIGTSGRGERGAPDIHFKSDNSYTTDANAILSPGKGHYHVVEAECEIWFGKKVRRGQVWHILFLDVQYMVFRYRNPKAEFISVYRRW